MTPQQLDHVPPQLYREKGTRGLRDWLAENGLQMSLLELDDERRRLAIAPPP